VPAVLYAAVLVAGLYSLAVDGSGAARSAGLVGAVAVLFAIELGERHRYPVSTPRGPAVLLLVLRVLAFGSVAALDRSGLSSTLFVLVPFAA
jgi:urea transporter